VKSSIGNFNEFQPITPWIVGVESTPAGQGVILDYRHVLGSQPFAQRIKIGHAERWVCFTRRLKIAFHPDVQLLRAAAKPAPAAGAQGQRFFDLFKTQTEAVELPRQHLAALRRGNLDVIDGEDLSFHLMPLRHSSNPKDLRSDVTLSP